MNPRERFIRAIRRQSVDKVPKHAFWTPEVINLVKEKTGFDDPDEYFGFEMKQVHYSSFDFNPKTDGYFKNLKDEGRVKKIYWDDWKEKIHGKKTIDEWGVYRDYGNY